MDATTPLHCHVEIPKGSRNKYEWDEGLQAIRLNRFLFASVVYPTDYGFIPETIGPKDEPLDAMVCVSAPTFPGCLIPVRVVAIMRSRDEKGQNDKLQISAIQNRDGKLVTLAPKTAANAKPEWPLKPYDKRS